jgi:hypothetical protein
VPAIVVHHHADDQEEDDEEQMDTPVIRAATLPAVEEVSLEAKPGPTMEVEITEAAGSQNASTAALDSLLALDDVAPATLPSSTMEETTSLVSSQRLSERSNQASPSEAERLVEDTVMKSIPNDRRFEPSHDDTKSHVVSSADTLAQVPPLDETPIPIAQGRPDTDNQESAVMVRSIADSADRDPSPIAMTPSLPVPDLPSPSPALSPLPISTTQLPLSTPRPQPPSLPTSPSPSPSPSVLQSPIPKPVPLPHHLLEPLQRVKGRYEDIQRGFRDCHAGLESLKSMLSSPQVEHGSRPIPMEILRVAMERLNDFVEDARVELEIRMSDEELLAKGYETLLAIPGAMGVAAEPSPGVGRSYPSLSASASSLSSGNGQGRSALSSSLSEPALLSPVAAISETERQIEGFVYGTDVSVRKARMAFEKKLEDAEHDIAALKRAIHDPDSLAVTAPSSSRDALGILSPTTASTSSGSGLLSPIPRPAAPALLDDVATGVEASESTSSASSATSSSWTSWIRGGSSPAPPATPATAPATFGHIMTSPRLRHSPSLQSGLRPKSPAPSLRGRQSSDSLDDGGDDVLQGLGLRVPMPKFSVEMASRMQKEGSERRGSLGSGKGVGGSVVSPLGATMQKPRTTSAMYMLGLGGRSASNPVGAPPAATRIGQDQAVSLTARSVSSPAAALMGQWSRGTRSSTPPVSQQRSKREERHRARMAERDIDGETDIETETEGEETETEDSGSDTDLE